MAAAGESIDARIASHDEYFCRMVNLVPAHLYLHNDEPELNSRYFKNKKLAAPMQQKKEESRKGKRAKFDPANMKTVVELQKERALEDKKKVKEAKEALADGDDDDEDDEDDEATGSPDDEEEGSDDDDDEGGEGDGDDDDDAEEEGVWGDQGYSRTKEPTGKVPSASKKPDGPLALVGTTPRAKSIDELKERLRLKIEEARARRGGGRPGSDQKKPRPGKEKDKHQQQRLNGKNATYAPGSGAAGADVGRPGKGRPQQMPVDQAPQPPPPPVPELTDIQFGMISGMEDGGKKKKGKGSLPNLLKKAQEKERRLKELQQTEEGKEEANALLWKDAIKSAHGEKILDDPKRLKKAIKKKQKLKEKSARQWQARQASVENTKKERQDKREANIKKRKLGGVGSGAGGADAGEAGKEQDGPGKGAKRMRRAGFEGKRHEFLNSGRGSESHGGHQKPQHGSHSRNPGTGSVHTSGGQVKGQRKMQHQGGGRGRR